MRNVYFGLGPKPSCGECREHYIYFFMWPLPVGTSVESVFFVFFFFAVSYLNACCHPPYNTAAHSTTRNRAVHKTHLCSDRFDFQAKKKYIYTHLNIRGTNSEVLITRPRAGAVDICAPWQKQQTTRDVALSCFTWVVGYSSFHCFPPKKI